ncbi:MAG: TrkH family potassium uptake protein [Planctomycetales bacterium]|nr:TrkH family potassium uptake protein [Planctomycetales bacterium]
MRHTSTELSYPVRWAVVAKYLAQLCLVIAALTAVPAVVAVLVAEYQSFAAFTIVTLMLTSVGLLGSRIDTPATIQTNEALLISCAAFLVTAIMMTVPMMKFGLSPSDALFESISAVTTTGLSTQADVQSKSWAFLFARAWIQWYGGLGIVMFSVALITRSGGTAKALMIADASDTESPVGVRLHARRVLIAYSALTIVGCILVATCGVGIMNAVCYSMAAVSTGGFSPHDDSVRGINLGGQVAVTLVSFGGAVPLYLYYRSYLDGWKAFLRDSQLRSLFVAACVVSILLSICMFVISHRSTDDSLVGATLLAVSAQTTTGFEPLEVASLGDSEKLFLMAPMLIGGSMGSSAGGIKLVRLLILVQLLRMAVVRASQPRHVVNKPHLFGHALSEKEIEEASTLLFAFIALIFVSWLPFVMLGYNPLDSLFEVVSACGTVGLSSGITSEDLPLVLKLVLSADMLMGRLEIYAWLVVLSGRTWIGKKVVSS